MSSASKHPDGSWTSPNTPRGGKSEEEEKSRTSSLSFSRKPLREKSAPETDVGATTNRIEKNYQILSGRLLQKMGKKAKVDYTPQFRALNEKSKEILVLYDDVSKCVVRVCKAHHSLYSLGSTRGDCLKFFGERLALLKDTWLWKKNAYYIDGLPTLGLALERIGETQKKIDELRLQQEYSTIETFLDPLNKFIKDDVAPARHAKEKFRQSKYQLEAAETKIKSATNKLSDPLALYFAQTTFHYYRRKYHSRLNSAFNLLSDVDVKKDCDITLLTVELIRLQKNYCAGASFCVQSIANHLDELNVFAETKRKEIEEKKKQKEEERAKLKAEAEATKYQPLLSLLSQPEMPFMDAICHSLLNTSMTEELGTLEKDGLLDNIVKALDSYELLIPLLKAGIVKEVEKSSHSGATLFRGNSSVTRLMTFYSRYLGRAYIANTVGPLIEDIVKKNENLEIDPIKVGKEVIEANTKKLIALCNQFLEIIINSIDLCPPAFRQIAFVLYAETCKKYADLTTRAVGSFVFLRFFCPFVSAPDSTGLIQSEVPNEGRRTLVLVSKVLQNLSNSVQFKEPYMKDMNAFLESKFSVLKQFLDKLAQAPAGGHKVKPAMLKEETHALVMPEIVNSLVKNLSAIGKSLTQNHDEAIIPQVAEILAALVD